MRDSAQLLQITWENININSYHLLSTFYELGTALSALDTLTHLIFTIHYMIGSIIIILQLRKLRQRRVQQFVQVYTASKR